MPRPSRVLFFAIFIVGAVAACTGPSFRPTPLPVLAVAAPPARPITGQTLLLVPGEHFAYEVHLHGITIGRVDLEVTDGQVISKFKTEAVAAAFETVQDDLVTTLDRVGGRAAASTETLVIGDDAKTFNGDASVAGNHGQTVHTALGVLRAWARPDAAPGYLVLLAAGKMWRLDVARPTVEDLQGTHALRIDGRVRAEKPIALVMWLAASDDRTPLRIELSNGEFHVVADLVRE